MNTAIGAELDGRLYTDLRDLKQITPLSDFYIRTRASKLLPAADNWQIHVRGRRRTGTISVADLIRSAKPLGSKLLECAGNTRGTHFGMMSVAQWDGVPISSLLEDFGISGRVLVSGFDRYTADSRTSTPGASWIFPCRDLLDSGAFLASSMNGQPLPPDHGAPVRLVVPGWYGCCCIKWVDRISMAGDRAEATTQMIEYAGRTHQQGTPKLAADYESPVIDSAAMPIRVEKWIAGREARYRIVGIAWGGTRPALSLEIRFNDSSYAPVDLSPSDPSVPWRLWTYWWVPSAWGTYEMTLRVADPGVRTRRLDLGYYVRAVRIEP